MHISHIRPTMRRMADETKSPRLSPVGGRRRTNSMWSCGGCLAAPTSLPYICHVSFCIYIYLIFLLACVLFSHSSHSSIWIIGPNYIVQELYSSRWSNTNGNQINYQMKTKEVAIISILFDSDKRWRAASVITTCPRNFSCLSTTHKFIPSKKILIYFCTRCHMSRRSWVTLKWSVFQLKDLDERIIFGLITMGEFLLVIEIRPNFEKKKTKLRGVA